MAEPHARSRTWLRCLLVGILVVGAASFYALGLHEHFTWDVVRSNLDSLDAHVQQNLVVAAIAFFLVYTCVTALSLPVAAILSLLAGALFGRVLGVGVTLPAATCGATLAFLASRFVLRDWVQGQFGAYVETLNRGIEKDGAFYLFTLRLVIVIPFWIINLGMGLTPIRMWTYVWVSFVGMLPGSILYVNAGTPLRELKTPGDVLSWEIVLSFAALGLAPLVFRKALAWRIVQRPSEPEA